MSGVHGYANPTKFKAGARCRTCSKVYDKDQYDDVRFCPAHSPDNDSEHARLGRLAVRLQDGFVGFCEHRRFEVGWAAADLFEHLCRGSKSQKQWWKWACQFHSMCENSIAHLEEPLSKVLRGRKHADPKLEITSIWAMKFWTGPRIHIWHCAWAIITTSGTYVFDPTGVQFGPDWALVSRFEEYQPLRIWEYSKEWVKVYEIE